MVVYYSSINKVRFPVYELPDGNWNRQDGLLFLEGRIVDDKNQIGDTLGVRRMQTPHKNILSLKNQLDTFRALILSNHKYFIDTNGFVFIYEKTKFCKLKYYKIKDVIQRDSFSRIKLENVKDEFKVPRPPAMDMFYAGCLLYGKHPWVLYDYAETKLKDTRRKV
jgi:hypothetical protein